MSQLNLSAKLPYSSFVFTLSLGLIFGSQLTACSKKEDSSYSANQAAPQTESASIASSPAVSAQISANQISATASSTTQTKAVASSPEALTLGNNIVNQQQTNDTFANKKMVVSAKANFQVKDVQQTANQIEAIARQHNGYIANSEIGNDDKGNTSYPIGNYQRKELTSYSRHAVMLVRVPKAQVGEFLQQLQQLISFLDNSQFSAKDVTLDIQKAQVEAQIQALKAKQISEQKADKTTQSGNMDVANQTALSRQEQLYADLQRQQLEDDVNLSTIELNFYQPEKIREQIVEDIDAKMQGEKSVNFLPRLSDNLKAGWLYLIEFVLFLSQFWSLIFGIALIWLAWRWLKKYLSKHATVLSQPTVRLTNHTNQDAPQNVQANLIPENTSPQLHETSTTNNDEPKQPE